MTDLEMMKLWCDRDAARWAREFNESFRKVYPGLCTPGLHEDWLIGWFANAMMCGEDTYRWRKETAEREREALRQAQALAVAPLIGNLLDHWDSLPNDIKDQIREVDEGLEQAIDAVQDAMEGR